MRLPASPSRVLAPLAAALLMSLPFSIARAQTQAFRMPDGSVETRPAYDVAPYLAAWKAAAFARERAAATATTPNQTAYDVNWYDLDLAFTPASSSVAGTVRMKATVVNGPLSAVDLDFYSNLVMDGATSAGSATTYSRAGNVLTLNLDRAYANGEVVDVTVTYHGVPTAAGYFGFQTVNGRQLIWSLSEAYGARTWWPCKDAPEDKADSVDIHFTCPSALTTVSNGTLVGTVNHGSTVTANWHERYPITTYLVFIAAYPYTITTDWYVPAPTDSLPLRFNMVPENAAGAAAVHAKVKTMIAAFAANMGEYPFMGEKYGHAEFTFGGGMEHQTNTCLGTYVEYVVAHELMHQWWGDLVTCWDFHHIWLNEGFATFGEALWAEHNGGHAAYMADLAANKYFGSGSIWVPDATDEGRVFDSNLSYAKGSWVLHMLRHMLGDATFFAALREYRTQYGYKSATTENFRDVCEAVSGRDLDAFFQQWIYGEYYPAYRAGWTATPAAGGWDVKVTLDQTQAWQLFTMPVDVTVNTASGDETFVVENSLASQEYVLHVNGAPTGVQIDKDDWILKTVELAVSNPTFERGVLLVNGIDWTSYGTELTSAYTDKAFWGDYAIDFWDTFAAPAGGYPATLPAPLGHGSVPPGVLGHYRVVIWLGNNFNGDLSYWMTTPILSYLRAGGDVLLLSRYGDQFLGDSLKAYLGVNWTSTATTIYDGIATRPGLTNLTPLGSQTTVSVFDTVRTTSESQLLWRVSTGFGVSRGIGAIRIPPAGMGSRSVGGRLAFLSGRPYRWNHTQLRTNVMTLLNSWFLESLLASSDGTPVLPARLALDAARPNPSASTTAMRFAMPRAGHVRLELLDVAGRRVRTLVDGTLASGPHEAAWDGRDDVGALAPAGLYWARLESQGETAVRRVVRLR